MNEIKKEDINPYYIMKRSPVIEEKTPHPWGAFLDARLKAIEWMHDEQGYSDEKIAYALSMDEKQVYSIRKFAKMKQIET